MPVMNWPYDERYVGLGEGNKVSKFHGHVTIANMAHQMGRIARWTGSGRHFFSDMLHSFVVADLVEEPYLKCHALLHDSPECVGNDVPSPLKLEETRQIEDAIMERTLDALGLPRLTLEERRIIKSADNRAAAGEAWVVGNECNRETYSEQDYYAEDLVSHYLQLYPYRETIEPDGAGPREFIRRFEVYYGWSKNRTSVPAAEMDPK